MNCREEYSPNCMCIVMGLELNIVIQERYFLGQDKNLKAKWDKVEGLNANNFGGAGNVITCCIESVLKARNIEGFKW